MGVVFNVLLPSEYEASFQNCLALRNFEKSGGKSPRKNFFIIISDMGVVFNVVLPSEHDANFQNYLSCQYFEKIENKSPKRDVFVLFSPLDCF